MKKFLVLILLFIGVSASAQGLSTSHKVYCEIVGIQKLLSLKCTIQVDFGQNPWGSHALVDESGKKITFNSMVDAMNHMGKLGWEFESAYVITVSGQNIYHWLLSKYITDEAINEGLTTKKQFKDEQKAAEKAMQESVQ